MTFPELTKEAQQKLMLYAVVVIAAGVLVFMFRDRLLPRPIGGSMPTAESARVDIPAPADKALFERQDFKDLRVFGDLPVKPVRGGGSKEPFLTEP